jgi:hypothetical protein
MSPGDFFGRGGDLLNWGQWALSEPPLGPKLADKRLAPIAERLEEGLKSAMEQPPRRGRARMGAEHRAWLVPERRSPKVDSQGVGRRLGAQREELPASLDSYAGKVLDRRKS